MEYIFSVISTFSGLSGDYAYNWVVFFVRSGLHQIPRNSADSSTVWGQYPYTWCFIIIVSLLSFFLGQFSCFFLDYVWVSLVQKFEGSHIKTQSFSPCRLLFSFIVCFLPFHVVLYWECSLIIIHMVWPFYAPHEQDTRTFVLIKGRYQNFQFWSPLAASDIDQSILLNPTSSLSTDCLNVTFSYQFKILFHLFFILSFFMIHNQRSVYFPNII